MSNEVNDLITGCMDDDTGTSDASENVALCNNMGNQYTHLVVSVAVAMLECVSSVIEW